MRRFLLSLFSLLETNDIMRVFAVARVSVGGDDHGEIGPDSRNRTVDNRNELFKIVLLSP